MGHIAARHLEDSTGKQRSQTSVAGSYILGSMASIGMSLAGANGGRIIGNLTVHATNTIGNGAFVKADSRKLEYEADQIQLVLMAKAGYDPRAAVSF